MQYFSHVLPNGLTILTTHMPYVRSVAINLIVKAGSIFEDENELGIAHFLEHMAFKGTKTRSAKQIAIAFDDIGGHFNAYTSKECTVYQMKILHDNLETAFEILSDVIQNSIFSQEEIEKEKDVITQEIAATYDNPDDLVFEKFAEAAFGDSPLGRSILGSVNSITKFDREDFFRFVGKHYFGSNMFLSIAGNVQAEFVNALAAKYFSNIKSGTAIEQKESIYQSGEVKIEKDLEQTTLALGFRGPGYLGVNDYYAAHLISIILGGGISSRLFQEIRENKALAYSVGSFISAYHDIGLFTIYASTSPEKALYLKDSLIEEVKNICKFVSQEELDRAKAQIKASFLMSADSASYKSEEIGRNYSIFGRFVKSEEIIELIEKMQLKDLLRIANQIFESKMTFASIGKGAI
jgi:predicted Zn-dependent peptidase